MAKETVVGDKALIRKLKSLEPRIANKVIKTELKAAQKEITAAVKGNTPVGETKVLQRAIKTRAMRSRKGRIAFTSQIGAGSFKGESYYGAFVDLGTEHIEPRGFMEKGFDEKSEAMKQELPTRIARGIEREAKK